MALLRTSAGLRAKANNMSHCFRARAKTVYEDEYMKLETHYNVTKNAVKDAVKDTAPYIVATGLGKIVSSFRRTQFRNSTTSTTTHRNADRGRIDKQKRFTLPNMGKLEEEARAKYEERQRLKRVAQRQLSLFRAEEARAIAKKETSYHFFRRQCAAPPEAIPEPSYLASLPKPDPTEDHVQRQEFVREKLASIVGEERMKMGVGLPSGHSGIDPVIAEYNQQKATSELWEKIDAWKVEERRKVEEHQRQLAQEEVKRQEMEILLQQGRTRYMERVEQLARFGPKLNRGIAMLNKALQWNNLHDAAIIVQSLTTEIIEPADAIFKEMNKDIPLESEGARILKEKWPVKQLDEVYNFLRNESSLPHEFVYFGQGIEAICKPLINPTPFKNPLDPKPVPAYESHQTRTSNANANFMANLATGGTSYPAPAPLAPAAASAAAPASADNSKSFMSWSDMVNASKGTNNNQQAPGITLTPPDCQEKTDVMLHMQSSLCELQMSVVDLLKGGGDALPSVARKDVTDTLQNLVDFAGGKTKFLGADEGVLYKQEVKRVQRRIANLANSAKKPIKTRELDTLAHNAMNLWVSEL